jgi:TatD DNase family protein
MIDTHCHLIDPQFKNDFDRVLERALNAGVTKIINAGYDVRTSHAAVEMGKNTEWLLPAVGIHPNEAAAESMKEMVDIQDILSHEKVIAIGETGLDYYRDLSPRFAQQELFRRHIDIARANELPLLIHTRNSIDDAIKLLNEEGCHHGVFHCFSGTYEQAVIILDMGFYLGFGGVLTFSKRIRGLFKKIPRNRIVLETDAPFLSPSGHRGKRNEPAYIFETLNTAANILNIVPDHLEDELDENARMLFALKNNK